MEKSTVYMLDSKTLVFVCSSTGLGRNKVRPTVSSHSILVMRSVKGKLYYCYGPHYEMGVAHTVGLYGALPKMAHKLVQQSIRNVLRPYCTNI